MATRSRGARVLDLFAGTGALGIEAISRGAAYALFVDDGVEARALLRDNVETLGLGGVTRIFRRDATRLGPAHPLEPFTLAFLDPPYGKGLAEKALASAREGGWLEPEALIVVEEARMPASSAPEGLRELERRAYDDTEFVFLALRLSVISARTAARYRRASAPHKSAGRGCTGRNWAPLPSRAAARSSLPA